MQLPEEIMIDGVEEHAFRRSIETMLRHGRSGEALEKLAKMLPAYAGEGKILPARLLEVSPSDLHFSGWDQIAAKLEEYGRAEIPITAVGIGICDVEDAGVAPDDEGNLQPPLETTYYSDATFPFSETDRDDLLEGYSSFGCEWQGDYDRMDHALSIEGIDDLYGAIASLEAQVAMSASPSADDIRAGAVGACYIGVLVYQAAREAALRQGLPRPLTILLVNSDAYPFFDAPVLTFDEYANDGEISAIEPDRVMTYADGADDEDLEDSASLASLVSTSRQGGKKKMALALEGDQAHNPLGMADDLISQAAFDPGSVDTASYMPEPVEYASNPVSSASDPDPVEAYDRLAFPVENRELQADGDEEPEADTPTPIDFSAAPRVPMASAETADIVPFLDPRPQPLAPAEAVAEDEPDLDELIARQSVDSASAKDAETDQLSGSFGQETDIQPEPAPAASGCIETDETSMPWHGEEADVPFPAAPARSASNHALRAKLRGSDPGERNTSPTLSFANWLARMFKRVQEFFARR